MMRSTGGRLIARPMAHLIEPEPRWRWWVGAAGEVAVLLLIVAFVVGLSSLQP